MPELEDAETIEVAEAEPRSFSQIVKDEAEEWYRLLIVFIPALFVFFMLAFEQRVIPSESMVPNLQVGDRVLVNKFSYGYSRYSIPWGLDRIVPLPDGRIFGRTPKRGDVIVFMHPHVRRVMIKRLVGIPGDRIEMRDEQLYLNGEAIETEFIRNLNYIPDKRRQPEATREYKETHGDKTFLVHQWRKNTSASDTSALFVVPEGHLLFIGDNRDNSTDGRALSGHCRPVDGVVSKAGCIPGARPEDASIGFVPINNIIGKGVTVAWTTKRCRKDPGLTCPPKRVWKGL